MELRSQADPDLTVRAGFRHTDRLAARLRGAAWHFGPDGRLDVTGDGVAFAGRYLEREPGTLMVSAVDESGTTLMGRLVADPGGAAWTAEVTYHAFGPTGEQTVDVTHRLGVGAAAAPDVVAAAYRVVLTGRTGAASFGPIELDLSLDRAPAALLISGENLFRVGELMWITDGDECTVTVSGDELIGRVDAPAGTATVTFTTPSQAPPSLLAFAELAATPVPATAAVIRLRVTSSGLTGSVTATGRLPSGDPVRYEATVTGRLV
ncbi:hypothetical protein ACQP00_29915 [Dactylosporangium sp. CS-047395]|uniref:hypothetical protein n=1 Tax=Dactylosporangium sp. CS-047395 TaxID=3239936 RepID=UPI003D92EAC4